MAPPGDGHQNHDREAAGGRVVVYSSVTLHGVIGPSVSQQQGWTQVVDIANKDCRRSISAIPTWVPENVKISARPLNSIGN